MGSKLSKNSKYVIPYLEADRNLRRRVRTRIENYLTKAEISQDKLAEQLTELLNVEYSRKTASGLAEFLEYPKKDKDLVKLAKQSAGTKRGKDLANENLTRIKAKLKELGVTKADFIKAWEAFSFREIKLKYKLSQHDCYILAEYYSLGEKPNSQYDFTYKDLYNELRKNGITLELIKKDYLIDLITVPEIRKKYSLTINRNVTEKQYMKMLKYLNIERTEEQLYHQKGRKSRREKAYAMNLLNKCGYTIEELAERYENELSLTKKRLIAELNSKIENDDFKFTTRWLSRYLDPLLTKTRLGSVSRSELEFREELIKLYPNERMETSVRTLIAPREVDIYFPDLNTAIEFNGDYWHSNEFIEGNHGMTSMEYHQLKYDECKKLGIELLFVWESDWNERSDEILLALDNYFTNGVSSELLCKLV
jgi:hypothetical protein